jgi:hypothetical protein
MFANRACLTIIIATACAATLAGCGNDKEAVYKSGGMTHTLAEGKDAIPKDFPLPLYPNASSTGSVSAQGAGDEQTKYLMISTPDSLDKVSEYYQGELKNTGWEVGQVETSPKLVSISATKKSQDLDSNVMIAEDGGKTTISLQSTKSVEIKKEDEEPSENYTPNKVTPPTD